MSDTFHGRDILAPVAAHLSKGLDMLRLGQEVELKDINRIEIPAPFVSAGDELVGTVISIDHFGKGVVVRLGRFKIRGVSKSYERVKAGSPVAIFGSRKLLEISLNQGDARSHFKARVGQAVKVKRVTNKD
ncbi:MAG: SAM-dependent chlorinase/fluorinase [Deltaproteobacteria bacterium]|nr:SAM-dependent chlorinase/fluorinase [Deltaproteobacteria bacterium]